MTETTVNPNATEEENDNPTTEEETPAVVDLSEHPDDTVRKLWAKVKAAEPQMHELYESYQKSKPPTQAEIDEVLKTSDDEEVTKLRKAVEDAEKRLANARTRARDHILSGFSTLSEEEVEKIRTDFNAVASKVKTLVSLVREIAETLDLEDVTEALDSYKVPSLRGMASNRASTEGQSRPQVNDIVVTKPGKEAKHYDKVSFAATYSGVKTSELYDAWMRAAGVTYWKDVKEEVTFTVGEDVEVTVVPKTA